MGARTRNRVDRSSGQIVQAGVVGTVSFTSGTRALALVSVLFTGTFAVSVLQDGEPGASAGAGTPVGVVATHQAGGRCVQGRTPPWNFTLQGLGEPAVVLHEIRIEVLERTEVVEGDESWTTRFARELSPRCYTVDFDEPAPVLAPERDTAPFPYLVDRGDPEQVSVSPVLGEGLVKWQAHVTWTSGDRRGELLVNDHGRPFTTVADSAVGGG